jgi:hypothetical protein
MPMKWTVHPRPHFTLGPSSLARTLSLFHYKDFNMPFGRPWHLTFVLYWQSNFGISFSGIISSHLFWQFSYCCVDILYCRAFVATIYKTGIGLTTGFIGSHTVTVYTLLQLTTVHYTCRVSSLCLHWLPVFQYLTRLALQDWLTDWRSARILTLLYSEDSLSVTH